MWAVERNLDRKGKKEKEPPSVNLCVSRIETVTAVSLILVKGRKKKDIAAVHDSDLNVNGFLKDLC